VYIEGDENVTNIGGYKMETVKIYRVTVTEAYIASQEAGTHYSLRRWNKDTKDYKGYDDGGDDYIVPDGFEVGEDMFGAPYFSKDGLPHELVTIKDRPAIIARQGYLFLKKRHDAIRRMLLCQIG